ncbi:MAG: DUF1134 domain-containing protein [Proteobacteria bacterium]|nr:DUF1134 domain-containing protein [Pseudomonadota bacterium]
MVSIRYIAFALVVAAFGWAAPASAQVADYALVEYEDGNGAVTNATDVPGGEVDTGTYDEVDTGTYDEDTILNEAGNFFGAGAEGLGKIVEKIFADLGRPSGYIKGTEGSAALIFGLRYGSGELAHKIEGNRLVHWTGPSIGLDAGGNLSKTFTLVYNLYDTEDLYHRYPAVEGSFYYIGGLGVNYQKRGEVVLAPIRLGVGLRAGANIGYLKYSKKRKILPF